MATMAPPKPEAKKTYSNIPPPPLPEWYLPKMQEREKDSTSSSSGTSSAPVEKTAVTAKTKTKVRRRSKQRTQIIIQEAPAYDGDADAETVKSPPICGDGTDEKMRVKYTFERTAPNVTFATSPPEACDVPPLAVYHICRICLRPRSARYHREHPIPINGVPPPPGICRRCRVNTVEEISKVATVVEGCGTSNKMKLGIAAFIPEEDYVSSKEMQERRGRELLRLVERQRLWETSANESTETGQEREIVYRHVKIGEADKTTKPVPPPGFKVRTSVKSTAQDAIDAISVRSEDAAMMTTAMAAELNAQEFAKTRSVTVRSQAASQGLASKAGFREIGEGAIVTGASRADNGAKVTAQALSAVSRPGSAQSSKAMAKATVSIAPPPQPDYTEADIRRIAREEVVKYRQAERKLEAHADPFAHGRMVPVERRIEAKEEAKPMPWERKTDVVEEVVMSRKKVEKETAAAQPRRASQVQQLRAQQSREPERVLSPPPNPAKSTSKQEGSVRSRPRNSQAKEGGWLEQEVVIECRDRRDSKTSASARSTSGSGWDSERPSQPMRNVRAPSATETIPRSERSERRKWDMMIETPTEQQGRESVARQSERTEVRSARSERRKWDAMAETPDEQDEPKPAVQSDEMEPRGTKAERKLPNDRVEYGKTTAASQDRPAGSVLLREIGGGEGRREIWLPPTGDFEVIEIVEKSEPAPGPREQGASTGQRRPTSEEATWPDRILELKSDADRQERAKQTPRERGGNTQTSPAQRAEGGSRFEERADRPAGARSTNYQGREETKYSKQEPRDEPVRYISSLSERRVDYGRANGRRGDNGDAREPRNDEVIESERPRSRRDYPDPTEGQSSQPSRARAFDLRMAAATAAVGGPRAERSIASRKDGSDSNSSDVDSGKTRWPTEQPASARSSRTGRSEAGTQRTKASVAPESTQCSRSAREPEKEYIVSERFMEPISQRWDSERFFELPGRRYTETTENVRRERDPAADTRAGSNATSRGEREPAISQAASQARSNATSKPGSTVPASAASRRGQAIYREWKGDNDSGHSSARVRFASKVDVSPTPPDSEASSVQFRNIGAQPSSRRKMMDGESGEDLIAEYELRRGRSRAREDGRRQDEVEYYYERREVTPTRSSSRRDDYPEREEVKATRPRRRSDRCPDRNELRSERTRSRVDDNPDRDDGGYTWSSEPRPLAQTFSESPSRELQREEPAWESQDAWGPYRPEMRQPESMDVLKGSSHGSGWGEERREAQSQGRKRAPGTRGPVEELDREGDLTVAEMAFEALGMAAENA